MIYKPCKAVLEGKIFVLLERAGFNGMNIRSRWLFAWEWMSKNPEYEKLFSRPPSHLDRERRHDLHICPLKRLRRWKNWLLKSLSDYHKNPWREAFPRKRAQGSGQALVSVKSLMLPCRLREKEVIVNNKDSVRLASHLVQLVGEEDALRQIHCIDLRAGRTFLDTTVTFRRHQQF